MPWDNGRDARRQSEATYNDPEYKRNRETRKRMAGGRCEECGHPHGRLQCDHIRNVASTGVPDHSLANLRMLCAGAGSCRCHERKTAQEGRGYRRPGGKPEDPPCQPRTQW